MDFLANDMKAAVLRRLASDFDWEQPTNGSWSSWQAPLEERMSENCGSSMLPSFKFAESSQQNLFSNLGNSNLDPVWTAFKDMVRESDSKSAAWKPLWNAVTGWVVFAFIGFLTMLLALVFFCTKVKACRRCVSCCVCHLCFKERERVPLREKARLKLLLIAILTLAFGFMLPVACVVICFTLPSQLSSAIDRLSCNAYTFIYGSLFGSANFSPKFTQKWLGFEVANTVIAGSGSAANSALKEALTDIAHVFTYLITTFEDLKDNNFYLGVNYQRASYFTMGALGILAVLLNAYTAFRWVRKYRKGKLVGHGEKRWSMCSMLCNGCFGGLSLLVGAMLFGIYCLPSGLCNNVFSDLFRAGNWDTAVPVDLYDRAGVSGAVSLPKEPGDIFVECASDAGSGDLLGLTGISIPVLPELTSQMDCQYLGSHLELVVDSMCKDVFPEMSLVALALVLLWASGLVMMFICYSSWRYAVDSLTFTKGDQVAFPDQVIAPYAQVDSVW